MNEIQITLYVTDDGEKFYNKDEAEEHEKLCNYFDRLSKYKFDGPSFIPNDTLKKKYYNYQWYKFNNKDDLGFILDVLRLKGLDECDIYSITDKGCFDFNKHNGTFPDYIVYSNTYKNIHYLSDILKDHKLYLKKWDEFYNYFIDDINNKG